MHALERVLLYIVVFAVGGMLLFDESPANFGGREMPTLPGNAAVDSLEGLSRAVEPQSSQSEISPQKLEPGRAGPPRRAEEVAAAAERPSVGEKIGEPATDQRERSVEDSQETAETEEPSPPEPLATLTLIDRAGRPRIELKADDEGTARIAVKNEAGRDVVSLSSLGGDAAEVITASGNGRIRFGSDEAGNLFIELNGKQRGHAHVSITADGETEIVCGSGAGGVETVMRTDREGAGEIAVSGPEGRGGPAMSVLPSGDMGLRISAGDATSGPVMQLFRDGLAEIAINGPDSQSGPSMMRLSNGVAVFSARLPNGKPGASMVASPDGTSVIAATSEDRQYQAALRVDAEGNAGVSVRNRENQDGQPEAKPKPPTPPGKSILGN